RFHRWDGRGRLAVQLQGGLPVADAFGSDSRLRIAPVPAGAWERGAPPSARRTTVQLRIGSEGREPVWATVPVVLHRPLPPAAQIKWVFLLRERIGTSEDWHVPFVLA